MLVVRKGKNNELGQITRIFIEAYSIKPYNEKWTYSKALKKIKIMAKEGEILVALVNKQIVGAIIYCEQIWDTGNEYSINEIFVKKEMQGKGIGTVLLDAVESKAKANKMRAVNLTSNPKSKAYKFYKSRGYKKEMVYLKKKTR